MFKRKTANLLTLALIGVGALSLTACGGSSDSDTPYMPSAVAQVSHGLPLTSVGEQTLRFQAQVTNQNANAITASTNAISITNIEYPISIDPDLIVELDVTGGVGVGLNCYGPDTLEGATLAPNESCNVIIEVVNESGLDQTLAGDIVITVTGATQSGLRYPIDITLLGQDTLLAQTGQTETAPINPAPANSDGDVEAGIAWDLATRFTVNSDVVTDTLTGLQWQKDPSDNNGNTAVDWNVALTTCNNYIDEQSGQTDWRLLNVLELSSLVDLAESQLATALNTAGFSNVQASQYWTSTTFASDTDRAGLVQFTDAGNGTIGSVIKSSSGYVWCVRGDTADGDAPLWRTGQTPTIPIEAPEGSDGAVGAGMKWTINTRFEISDEDENGRRVVTDTLTGLQWPQNPSDNAFVNQMWNNALTVCSSSGVGGFTDWRLPNRTELYSLIDWSSDDPATTLNNNGFVNVASSGYWTSSTSAQNTANAWRVDFSNGTSTGSFQTKTNTINRVWCVRG